MGSFIFPKIVNLSKMTPLLKLAQSAKKVVIMTFCDHKVCHFPAIADSDGCTAVGHHIIVTLNTLHSLLCLFATYGHSADSTCYQKDIYYVTSKSINITP